MNLTRFISVILLFAYSISAFVNVGMINCGCTHSQRMVMMSTHLSCICSHSIGNCCSHNDQHHHDEEEDCGNGCCYVVNQNLEVDQLNVKQSHESSAKFFSLFLFPVYSIDGLITSIKDRADAIKNNSPPLGLFNIPLFYMYAQLRL